MLLDCGASSEGAVNDFGKQSNSLDDVAYIQLLAEYVSSQGCKMQCTESTVSKHTSDDV